MTEHMEDPGYLCLKKPLPGMGRSLTDISKKDFGTTYFKYTGKLCACDVTLRHYA